MCFPRAARIFGTLSESSIEGQDLPAAPSPKFRFFSLDCIRRIPFELVESHFQPESLIPCQVPRARSDWRSSR
jgi:hypothetical protein